MMHIVTHAELAATISKLGPSIVATRPSIPVDAIHRYWVASRSRHELWHRAMACYRDALSGGNYRNVRDWWTQYHVLLEEIIVSELLTRVVAVIGAQVASPPKAALSCDVSPKSETDDSHQSLASVTHGIFISHLEACNRVGQLMLQGRGARVQDLVRLNRLRQGVERWLDWLVGQVSADPHQNAEYCIDVQRAAQFSQELRQNTNPQQNETMRWLMGAAMREMLIRRTSVESALGDANQQVASAALALFRPNLFDENGIPKSDWKHLLCQRSDRTSSHESPSAKT